MKKILDEVGRSVVPLVGTILAFVIAFAALALANQVYLWTR